MAAKKLAISLDDALVKQVRRAARKAAAGNVSAWLAEAARQRLRHDSLVALVRDYEAEAGAFTDDELARVDEQWPPD